MNLSGHWKGIISYGPEYGDWENKELYFTIDLIQNGDTFVGTSEDIGGIGCNPDIADIEGFIDSDAISFRKQYRSTINLDEDDVASFEQDKPSHEIEYFGRLNKNTNKIDGDWQINVDVKQLTDSWLVETWTGSWVMTKEQ